jgi:fatty acid desaturase
VLGATTGKVEEFHLSRQNRVHSVPPALLQEFYRQSWPHNLKIFLIYGALITCGVIAWRSSNPWIVWPTYVAMGYLWMGVVTFMHDCVHLVLFKNRWKNWAFGIFSTLPILITFTVFMDDHLEHHRHNRSSKDPDAFTMGARKFPDFLLFYGYILIGGFLTVVQFNLIYPFLKLRGTRLWIHLAELTLRIVTYTAVIAWASAANLLGPVLSVWLIPVVFFSFFNTIRFIAEHYDTPWDAGPMMGTRTVISNRVNSFFWNNINYHIGHHVYPAVPWYNLPRLHEAMRPTIEAAGARIDASYLRVFWEACVTGPETIERNRQRQLGAASGRLAARKF